MEAIHNSFIFIICKRKKNIVIFCLFFYGWIIWQHLILNITSLFEMNFAPQITRIGTFPEQMLSHFELNEFRHFLFTNSEFDTSLTSNTEVLFKWDCSNPSPFSICCLDEWQINETNTKKYARKKNIIWSYIGKFSGKNIKNRFEMNQMKKKTREISNLYTIRQ